MIHSSSALKEFLDQKVYEYNNPSFIEKDPISIPHKFNRKQDIEISGLFAATLAWGRRTTIITNLIKLMTWMDFAPYQFIREHTDSDLEKMLHFSHRTFNTIDLLYFIHFLQFHYTHNESLEDAFIPKETYTYLTTEQALIQFHNYFFSIEHPERTRKHVATPERKSACKRMNMFLRWMVRSDNNCVDFGIWKKIKPHQLICPIDVHVARVAHRLQLLENKDATWANAIILTHKLKELNNEDPVVYDYALFGLGLEGFGS